MRHHSFLLLSSALPRRPAAEVVHHLLCDSRPTERRPSSPNWKKDNAPSEKTGFGVLSPMQFKSILLLALVVAAAASKDDKSFLRTIKDKLCPDGKQRCLNDEPCCAFTPGSDGCCSSDESCCADDQGASCCIIQPTYCVPKNANLNPYPARCCPRYTVGCNVGEVGCCDPAV